nr:hypothetical protein [Tanacetum cinerariifolium]
MDENLIPHAQRDILHICQRVHGQSFTEPPFEEEILAFICFLGHSAAIRMLTDVNINKLYQPLRSFAAIINKYLTGKSSGYDSLRLSQAQILKNKFGALLPIELTNAEIENSKAYKEYYAIATGEAAPKPKASVRRTRSSSDTSITPPIVAASPRLTASTHISQPSGSGTDERTGSKLGVPNVPTDESEEELSWDSTDDEGDDNKEKDDDGDEEDEGDDGEEGNGDDDDDEDNDGDEGKEGDNDDVDQEVVRYDDKDDEEEGGDDEHEFDEDESNEETRDEESFDPIPQTLKTVKKKQSSSVSSQFMTSLLNLTLDVGIESIFETTSQLDVPTPTSVAPLPITAPKVTPSTIASITTTSQAPTLPTTFARAVSSIPEIVNQYMNQRMNKAVKVAVQIQSDRLRDEAQRENVEFLRTVDENMKKIIKEQVKEQVK